MNSRKRSIGNYAEDAIQEGYALALEYWYTYDMNQPFENWMQRILSNATNKMHRWVNNYPAATALEMEEIAVKSSGFQQAQARQAYLRIQETETPRRTCLQNVLIDQCTFAEAATLTGVNQNTIKSWVVRWRKENKELYR